MSLLSNRWAERTVAEFAAVAREMATQERWAQRTGFLQRRDARVKWLATLCFLLTVGLLRHLGPMALACAVPPIVAALSGIPPRVLIRRALTFGLPFLVLLALFALSPSAGGWPGALRLLLRSTACLSATLLLVLATRWRDLTGALRVLGVPPIFVAVLERTHQYLFQLPLTASEMTQARRARTVGRAPLAASRRFVGASVGALLGKSHAAAEASHQALLARGYSESGPVFPARAAADPIGSGEIGLSLGALGLSLALLAWDRVSF